MCDTQTRLLAVVAEFVGNHFVAAKGRNILYMNQMNTGAACSFCACASVSVAVGSPSGVVVVATRSIHQRAYIYIYIYILKFVACLSEYVLQVARVRVAADRGI